MLNVATVVVLTVRSLRGLLWEHGPVSDQPPRVVDESEELFCYGHPGTPTRLRCTRCDRPICGRCAIPASVGQHCPECVAEARRSAPRVRSALRAAAPAVYTILVINVVFYFAQQLVPGLTFRLGLNPIAVFNGDWWRLLTPMILHGGLLHIFFNSYILFIYGPDVEQAFGTRRFAAIYLISGFTGGASSYAFSACNILGVGASGAIFGIVGALLVFLYRRRGSAMLSRYMNGILLFVVLNLVLGQIIPGIDNYAHLGGLVGGLLLGAALDRSPSAPAAGAAQVLARRVTSSAGAQAAAAGGVALLGLALVAWRTLEFAC